MHTARDGGQKRERSLRLDGGDQKRLALPKLAGQLACRLVRRRPQLLACLPRQLAGAARYALGRCSKEAFKEAFFSFLPRLDGAQGFHASYPEKYDPAERAYLGKGVALKLHAGAAYTTDALSAAAVRKLFDLAVAPLQNFYNRSTMRSGSTLGAIGLSQATVLSADLGVPQLAMHSAVETMALSDAEALHKGLRSFWTHRVRVRSDRVEIG